MGTTKSIKVYRKLLRDHAPRNITHHVHPYQYWAKVIKIVDGDTIDIEVHIGFEITLKIRTRLIGVNTPELHGVKRSTPEYTNGKKARDYVAKRIPTGSWIEVKVYAVKREKYGRWLGEIFTKGENLNRELINKGYYMDYE